jgi:hypothetical protein
MVVDQNAPTSDPLVFTGSHNWSAAADNDNDENTLIIHDATIANIYYQNFVKRFVDNNGVLLELNGPPTAVNDTTKSLVGETVTVSVLANDIIQSAVTVSIETQPKNGTAYPPFTDPNAISFEPNPGFEGKDSVTYKIVYTASTNLFSTAKVYYNVVKATGLSENSGKSRLMVFPNPAQNGSLQVSCFVPSACKGTIQLLDITGKLVFQRTISLTNGENMLKYNFPGSYKGTYLLRLTTTNKVWNQKVMFE